MERRIRLLTVGEAAKELRVSPEKAWSYISDGKLTASRIDGRWLLSELQLKFFMDRHAALLEHAGHSTAFAGASPARPGPVVGRRRRPSIQQTAPVRITTPPSTNTR